MPPTVKIIQRLLNYLGHETHTVPAMLSEGTWYIYTTSETVIVHLAGTLDSRGCVRDRDAIEFDSSLNK